MPGFCATFQGGLPDRWRSFGTVSAVLSRRLARHLLAGLLAWLPATGGAIAGEASIQERLATASPARGEALSLVCRACHGFAEDAAPALGPNLWGLLGREVASEEGYDRYSPAMAAYAGVWSLERLDRYLRSPAEEIEGTSMVFPGVPDAGERADIIAWLGVVSGSLTPPDGGFAASDPDESALGKWENADFGLLVTAEGAAVTHAYCTVCHSERIVAQQGLTREDWLETLEYMVDEHGMAPIEGPEFDLVVDYLSTHYGPDRPNFPSP